jgi:tetratricopeptide (TPR) repeat protein
LAGCTAVILLTAVLVMAVLTGAAAAQGGRLTIDADRQYALAQSLFSAGDFLEAGIEYRRFAHFFPDDPRVETALYRIGRCYFNLEDYGRAIDAFYGLIDRFPGGARAADAYRGIAASHLKKGEPAQAAAVLEQLIAAADDLSVIDDANYRIGWIYLDAADWKRARIYFHRVRPQARLSYPAEDLLNELNRVPDIPRKNPDTAGLLAILPGAGHFYCGRYRDGLIALVLNAAFIAAAWEAFDNDLPILGGVIAGVGAGFYVGNIYSAVGSAHKYNRAQERRFIEGLKKRAGPQLSLGLSENSLTAVIRVPF